MSQRRRPSPRSRVPFERPRPLGLPADAPPIFTGGRRRRGRSGALLSVVGVLAVLAAAVGGGILVFGGGSTGAPPAPVAAVPADDAPAKRADAAGRGGAGGGGSAEAQRFALNTAPEPTPVQVRFHRPPRAGLLFDVDSGEVLWRRNSRRRLPIASLTKMMTALITVTDHQPLEKVLITRRARLTPGSAVGVLPAGKRVRMEALLGGLLLVSGNDAAVAIAQDDSGTVQAFTNKMNERAAELGLTCSHFNTPHGLRDTGNYSCADDLAVLARADLAQPRIAAIARRREIAYPFPIKGGRLFLTNNNPLLRAREPGITGLKTGYTAKAGRNYVTTARRGGRHLGVILLHSPDPIRQIRTLLRLGARQ